MYYLSNYSVKFSYDFYHSLYYLEIYLMQVISVMVSTNSHYLLIVRNQSNSFFLDIFCSRDPCIKHQLAVIAHTALVRFCYFFIHVSWSS